MTITTTKLTRAAGLSAVVGGLLFSQLVTLYLTPVVYTYMAAAQDRFRSRKEHSVTVEPTVA